MIAYNKTWLEYEWIHEQLDKAFHETYIERDELKSIKKIYEIPFYTPQVLIGLGLFILATVVLIFSFGLLVMFFPIGGTTATYGIESLFFGLATYFVLEWIVSRGHFRSGVDEALLWGSAIFLIMGINFCLEISPVYNAAIVFGLSIWYSLRFLESLMGVVAFISLLAFVVFTLEKQMPSLFSYVPFILILVSVSIYFLTANLRRREAFRYYRRCLLLVEMASLLAIYLAGNRYVVSELGKKWLHVDFLSISGMPMDKIYWVLSLSIPCIYLLVGVLRRDIWMLRVALVTAALTVFTIRYYYHLIRLDIAMIVGGVLLIGISFALLKWLRRPKFGFNIHEDFSNRSGNFRQLESIMIGQLLISQKEQSTGSKSFGGGSGDGAGAGGEF